MLYSLKYQDFLQLSHLLHEQSNHIRKEKPRMFLLEALIMELYHI